MTVDVGGQERELRLHQVAPGTYEATTPVSDRDGLAVRWRDADTALERHLMPAPNAESRYRPPDAEALRRIAEATGGTFDPDLTQLLDPGDQTVVRPTALWPALAALALIAYLVNMLLRRVRVIRQAP
ncbi:MAG: hypothetical protein GWN53_00355 [Gammaproteobacteria bacterium]|nr:hypothetical protein [Gammaproteobacteria bacterium]